MGRPPCCDESGLKKGPWTPEEDEKLLQYIQKNGHGSWRTLPRLAGLNRCGKSCRLRWTNYLRPDIKRGKFSQEEERTILHLHSILGNKWSAIATHLPGRTDNEIKNFWNTHLKKRLIKMGLDPMTHRPRTDFFAALPQLIALAALREQLGAAGPAPDAEMETALGAITSPHGTPPGGTCPASMAAGAQVSCTTTFEEPVNSELLVAANQGRLSYGAADDMLACQGDVSLPPLTDLSDAANPGDGCSATSSFGDGAASSPLPWPEFFLDDPFVTDFL